MRLGLPKLVQGRPIVSLVAFDISLIANQVYEYNFHTRPRPITHPLSPNVPSDSDSTSALLCSSLRTQTVQALSLAQAENAADIWTLSPPCQPFTRTRGATRRDAGDPRSEGLYHLLSLLLAMTHLPRFILMENVAGFIGSQMHRLWVSTLTRCGYELRQVCLSPQDTVGLPNARRRYYCIARFVGNRDRDRDRDTERETDRDTEGQTERGNDINTEREHEGKRARTERTEKAATDVQRTEVSEAEWLSNQIEQREEETITTERDAAETERSIERKEEREDDSDEEEEEEQEEEETERADDGIIRVLSPSLLSALYGETQMRETVSVVRSLEEVLAPRLSLFQRLTASLSASVSTGTERDIDRDTDRDRERESIEEKELRPLFLSRAILSSSWAPTMLSIVTETDRLTYCFTKGYGKRVDHSAGSCLFIPRQTERERERQTERETIDRSRLADYEGRIRLFHPDEQLLLFGFPEHFRFPPLQRTETETERDTYSLSPSSLSLQQRWGCVGNSVNVSVVKIVARCLFEDYLWALLR